MKFPEVKMGAVVWLVSAQLPVGAAQAQTTAAAQQLEEIVVTAERRKSDVQETASSISVRTGSELRDQGRYTLGQILEGIPGITGGAAPAPVPGGSGVDTSAPGLTIRGIKSNTGSIGSVTSVAAAAAVYVDGVYEGVGGGYDIDRVEVLRGPQGTLYGRSATSGLLAIHTKDPQLDRAGGDATVEMGNFNLRHYTGAVSVPLVENVLGIRVAGNRYERDGYLPDAGEAVASNDGKVKLLYKPNDAVSLLLGFALQNNSTHTDSTTVTLSAPDTYAYTPTPVRAGRNEFRQYWAQFDWDLGFATLTYQPAYRTWESKGATASRGAVPALNIDSTIEVPRDRFHTQELRLSSSPDSTLLWQAGAIYYENSLSSHLVTTLGTGIVPVDALVHDKTTRATGVFAEATYPFADSWRVTAGVRYDETKVSVVEDYTAQDVVPPFAFNVGTLSGEAGTRSFDNVTYKARLEHDLTVENMLYASVSTGFSPGDVTVTTGASGNPYVLELSAETLTAYEIGSKNRLLDNRLQVNGAVYFYDYGSYQSANVDISPAPNITSVTLAAPAEVWGGEIETLFQLTPSDRVALNLAYTNAKFVDKDRQIDTGIGSTVTFAQYFARDEIPDVTPFTGSLSYDRIFRLPADSTLTLHAAVRYMSEHALTNLPANHVADGTEAFIRVDAEWVGDLSATWASGDERFSVTGYVRNIDDNRYKSTAFIQDIGVVTILSTPYDPRTYGAVLNVHF